MPDTPASAVSPPIGQLSPHGDVLTVLSLCEMGDH
jgi:hypothetical protein